VALVLHEVINEVPMDTVAAKYKINRSMIARLQVNPCLLRRSGPI